MAISLWRLPEGLGGAVVNPVRCEGSISAQARYSVQVPGTNYRIYVPSECLVPVLPEEPPVNSIALVLKPATHNWQLYVRQSVGAGGTSGRWAAPGNTGIVHTWQAMHQDWDQVHVLLWWDKDLVEEGVSLPSGPHAIHPLVISDPDEDMGEPGVAKVRLADGRQKDAHLDRATAIRAAGALLGLAIKEWM